MAMWARKLASPMPRGIGSSGIGACTIVSHWRPGGAHLADDREARRHVGQNLGDALADLAQLAATAGLADTGRQVHHVAACQLGRQLAALLLLRLRGFANRRITHVLRNSAPIGGPP